MFLLKKPDRDTFRAFLDSRGNQEFSYAEVGATAAELPEGYVVDRTRVQLGSGEETFVAAKAALRNWAQYRQGWVEMHSPQTPLREGEVVAVAARVFGLWWLNACRIVYAVDDAEPTPRFGFAYGTLQEHAESGEERFLVEWDRPSDGVWYDIVAFSRPRHPLARLGYPFARRLQKRFARDSGRAMLRAVTQDAKGATAT